MPLEAIRRLEPDIHCKGRDYATPNGKPIPEAVIVEAYAGRIEFLPMVPSVSTSDLVEMAALFCRGPKRKPESLARSASKGGFRSADLTTMKYPGCVAVFFHRASAACRNELAFLNLSRRSTMKNVVGVFHRAPFFVVVA